MQIGYFIPGLLSAGPLGPEELERRRAFLNRVASTGTSVEVYEPDEGPESVESSVEEHMAVEALMHALPALADRCDALVVGCFGDPGLAAAREFTSVPVIGPGQAAALAGLLLGDRIGLLSVVDEVVPSNRRQMRTYGLEGLVAGVRAVGIPVLELRRRGDEALERVEAVGSTLIEDGADVLVLACMSMGFLDVTGELEERLGVPVVNPVIAAVRAAETVLALGTSPSRRAFPAPRKVTLASYR